MSAVALKSKNGGSLPETTAMLMPHIERNGLSGASLATPARVSIFTVVMLLVTFSCKSNQSAYRPDESFSRLFTGTKGALVTVFKNTETAKHERSIDEWGTGFFISETGTILTAAYLVETTRPAFVICQSGSLLARVIKRNTDLGLAVLQPEAVRTSSYLVLDFDSRPETGQGLALLPMLPYFDVPARSCSFVSGIFPGTIAAVLHDGRPTVDVFPVTGAIGAPAVDPATFRVVGVGVTRDRRLWSYPEAKISLPMPDQTTRSLPVFHIVRDFAIIQPVFGARGFLASP